MTGMHSSAGLSGWTFCRLRPLHDETLDLLSNFFLNFKVLPANFSDDACVSRVPVGSKLNKAKATISTHPFSLCGVGVSATLFEGEV